MILIYSHKNTTRLQYTLKVILQTILGTTFQLTTDKEEFNSFNGSKFSYCFRPIHEELHFKANQLLFESGINEQEIKVTRHEGLAAFFPVKDSAIPFDIFSMSFYLISRYEEYLPHIRDQYDRYSPKESIAFQNRFLDKPLINLWAKYLKKILIEKFPTLPFEKRSYKFISTLDIDNAYAYRQKGIVRTLGASTKLVSNLKFGQLLEQLAVVFGLKKDPFDTFDYQVDIHKKYNILPIYFFLVADYGLNDKNIPVESRSFQALIKSIADDAEVGIHPGYGSNEKIEKLEQEIRRLQDILKKEVTKSRQHFLKLSLPETYSNLISMDIREDYTMGYAAAIGFRASICVPFNFYDLDQELETNLKIYPFAVMDASLKYYKHCTVLEAKEIIKDMIETVKEVDGTFISLWHNESLSDSGKWVGWKSLYEYLIIKAKA